MPMPTATGSGESTGAINLFVHIIPLDPPLPATALNVTISAVCIYPEVRLVELSLPQVLQLEATMVAVYNAISRCAAGKC